MKQPTHAYYAEELKTSQARLAGLNERGIHALSRYDLEIANQGDAEQALRTAKYFVRNHITYFTEKIAELDKKPRQLALLGGESNSR
jgi:hypothetical protein